MSVYFIFLVKSEEGFFEIKVLLIIIPWKYPQITRRSFNKVGSK